MSCQHEINEIDTDMFGLPEDKEYIEEIDTGDESLWGQDSQPTQIGKRSTSHMHESPDEEAKNAQSQRLRREDQTAQHSVPGAELAHRWRLRREDQNSQHSATENAHSQLLHTEDQTAQRSAAEADNAHSPHLRREDHNAQRLAAVTKKSSQVPPASSAPPIASCVKR